MPIWTSGNSGISVLPPVLDYPRGTLGGIEGGNGVERARPFGLCASDPAYEALCLQPQRLEEGLLGRRRPEEAAFLRVPGAEDLDLADVSEREPPSQRDQPGGAAGKRAQHLGALSVARDGRVGQGLRGDG